MFVHPEEQLPAWWEQRGISAGRSKANEAERTGDTALIQRDAGHGHWAQPALAGNTHKPLLFLAELPVCACSCALTLCALYSTTCPVAAAQLVGAATGRNPRRRTPWVSCRTSWWRSNWGRPRLKLSSEQSNLKSYSWRARSATLHILHTV